MSIRDVRNALERVSAAGSPRVDDLELLLQQQGADETAEIFAAADRTRRRYMGDGILLRGIVEFSSFCRNTCFYCGLHAGNTRIERYRMSRGEILESVGRIASQGIQTVVLQSGEDAGLDASWLAELVRDVKKRFGIAVTLSVGERSREDYELWREAGADRYLLKIESSDKKLYESLHDGRRIETRLRCLFDLTLLGYQVGCGMMVGLKGQSARHIAGDIVFFAESRFDMIGIGPFIPHSETRLGLQPAGSVPLTLKTVALTRIVTKNAHLPATTALGSMGRDYRIEGLAAGANVLMPNFTPAEYKKLYEIYPGKRCVSEPTGACGFCMEGLAASIGRTIDYSRGDSLVACSLPSARS
ncbi:MAG TPA: [FeFe] hydrogenase H-cluster radical SAM maturase HydE [Spirochaetia bacterium]|nr:[FeFe] hydrogenase H-cluster radical SAM maturase HydE [Spirochaetia bacterium]